MIRLICLDMDGVLTQWNNFWLRLHDAWGTHEEGYALTQQYLRTDYARLMQEVLDRLWVGKELEPYQRLVESVPLSPGIEEFFKELDGFQQGQHQYFQHDSRVPRAIISSGPYHLALRIQEQFGMDFVFGNELIFENGIYRGAYHWNVDPRNGDKPEIMRQLCDDLDILPQHVLYIGDDALDLAAFREAGVSIAFNAKSDELKAAATYVVDSADLRDVIPILRTIRGLAHQA